MRTNADFAAGVGTFLGTIVRALNAAIKSEPDGIRTRGEALAATLSAYARAPTPFMRSLVRADLDAFEEARR